MSNLYSAETLGLGAPSVQKPYTAAYGGVMRRYRATLNLGAATSLTPGLGGAGVAVGVPYPVAPTINVNPGDNVLLANIPSGAIFDFIKVFTTVGLGSAVIAIGTSPIHANNGQFLPATMLGNAGGTGGPVMMGALAPMIGNPLAAPFANPVYLTCAGAALPAVGTLLFDLYFTAP